MTEAAEEIRKDSDAPVKCGVSVDGTWQRRGFSSLNGCVTAVSIDTGKILDLEVMSQIVEFVKIPKKRKQNGRILVGSRKIS